VTVNYADPQHPDEFFYARRVVELLDRNVEGITLDLLPTKTITGTVKAEGPLTVPFSAMNVELYPDDAVTPRAMASTRVNADGTFTTHAWPEGYSLTRLRIPGAYMKSVKMGDRELPGAHIDFSRLDGPLTILFGMDAGSVEGAVANAQGKPTLITLIPAGEQRLMERLKFVNTDENGKFTMPAVAPGEYKIFAWQDTEPGAPLDPEFRKPYDSQAVNVRVEPNARTFVELKPVR
jgi:hypothetical protein